MIGKLGNAAAAGGDGITQNKRRALCRRQSLTAGVNRARTSYAHIRIALALDVYALLNTRKYTRTRIS